GAPDRARVLSAAGRECVGMLGRVLEGENFDAVLCSPAARTRETAGLLLTALGNTVDVAFVDGIYDAAAGDLLRIVREKGGGARDLLLVGHNPGVSDLAR